MKVSLQWLNELVPISDLSPQAIAERLTFAGVEVEGYASLASGTHLTTGLVLTQQLIEGSNHLSKLSVDTGKHGVRTIVCGASNVKAGQKVIVALPGAQLGKIKIGESKIRGVESAGMVCSLVELGVANKFLTANQIEGIEVLPADTAIGRDDVLAMLGLDDTILELKVLANRPDLWSVYGIALELGALFERPVKSWKLASQSAKNLKPGKIAIDIASVKGQQFSLKEIAGLSMGKTPPWMIKRLMGSGIRAINFLVDIGNYVMLLTGQPLHMYDLDKLPEKKLTVHDAMEGGKFIALDGKEYALKSTDLAISSKGQVMCLAGVMGALNCAVDEKTKNVAIEAALFQGTSVRKTALRLNLISDSSQRFSKGINPWIYEDVLAYTASLIRSLTSYESESQTISQVKVTPTKMSVPFTVEGINHLLGTTFSKEEIVKSLQSLGFTVQDGAKPLAYPPHHRLDVTHQADLAEEVIRLRGFKHVIPSLPKLALTQTGLSEFQAKKRLVKSLLRGQGLDETLTYTLVSKEEITRFNWLEKVTPYALLNPLTEERKWVRTSLLQSMIGSALYNLNYQNKNLSLFEIGTSSSQEKNQLRLAVILMGQQLQQGLLLQRAYDFYALKALVENILQAFSIDSNRAFFLREENFREELHPGKSAKVMIGNTLFGVFGELTPTRAMQLGFGKQNIVVGEFNLSLLFDTRVSATRLETPNKFPRVERDLAFILDAGIDYQTIQKTVRRVSKELIADVAIFDVYQGEHVPAGQKSVAIKIIIEAKDRTLTDGEVTLLIDKVKVDVQKAFKVTFRT